jgi:hypothetical protein
MLAFRNFTAPRRRAAAIIVVLLTAMLAGCVREGDENAPEGGDTSPGQIAIEVELTDDAIEMPDEISAGSVIFEVTNSGTAEHGFAIEGTDASLESLTVDQLDTVTVVLEPGTYTAFSPVDGDRESGLERSFSVTDAPDSSGAPLFDEGVEPGENQGSPSEDQSDDGG